MNQHLEMICHKICIVQRLTLDQNVPPILSPLAQLDRQWDSVPLGIDVYRAPDPVGPVAVDEQLARGT